jgi:hypothetical protein
VTLAAPLAQDFPHLSGNLGRWLRPQRRGGQGGEHNGGNDPLHGKRFPKVQHCGDKFEFYCKHKSSQS